TLAIQIWTSGGHEVAHTEWLLWMAVGKGLCGRSQRCRLRTGAQVSAQGLSTPGGGLKGRGACTAGGRGHVLQPVPPPRPPPGGITGRADLRIPVSALRDWLSLGRISRSSRLISEYRNQAFVVRRRYGDCVCPRRDGTPGSLRSAAGRCTRG